jgi:hypothetical protein
VSPPLQAGLVPHTHRFATHCSPCAQQLPPQDGPVVHAPEGRHVGGAASVLGVLLLHAVTSSATSRATRIRAVYGAQGLTS